MYNDEYYIEIDCQRNITLCRKYCSNEQYVDAFWPWYAYLDRLCKTIPDDICKNAVNILYYKYSSLASDEERESLLDTLLYVYERCTSFFYDYEIYLPVDGEVHDNSFKPRYGKVCALEAYSLELMGGAVDLKDYYYLYKDAMSYARQELDPFFVERFYKATIDFIKAVDTVDEELILVDNFDMAIGFLNDRSAMMKDSDKDEYDRTQQAILSVYDMIENLMSQEDIRHYREELIKKGKHSTYALRDNPASHLLVEEEIETEYAPLKDATQREPRIAKQREAILINRINEVESTSFVDTVSFQSTMMKKGDVRNNYYVFILANEKYPQREVPFALNDGRQVKRYFEMLGIPSNQIKIYENATVGNFIACIASIRNASKANNGKVKIIFYYAGHGFPDEETKESYLMPVDGDSKMVESCYSMKKLYEELGSIPSEFTLCFLDACFSGTTRDDQMLLTGRGVAIKPKEEVPQGNLIVFSSSSGSETSHQYEKEHHGLFTYYLLYGLQNTKGDISLGDLYDYLLKNVKKTSYDVNNRIQTPTVRCSPNMSSKWRDIFFIPKSY